MIDLSEFESISPYTDAEAAEALSKLADYPLLPHISQKVFPNEEPEYLKNPSHKLLHDKHLEVVNCIDAFKKVLKIFRLFVWKNLLKIGRAHV